MHTEQWWMLHEVDKWANTASYKSSAKDSTKVICSSLLLAGHKGSLTLWELWTEKCTLTHTHFLDYYKRQLYFKSNPFLHFYKQSRYVLLPK